MQNVLRTSGSFSRKLGSRIGLLGKTVANTGTSVSYQSQEAKDSNTSQSLKGQKLFCRHFCSTSPMNQQDQISGANALVTALKAQGIEYIFGIVGIPVVEIATEAQKAGIKFIGMRNEQAASYAASAIGFLSQRPGVCLVVSGPGLIHALSGMANAQMNAWPLLVVGGASEVAQEGQGAFQEYPQVEASRLYCKFAARPSSIASFPFFVDKALRNAVYGRPGVSYLDIPGDMIEGEVPRAAVKQLPQCPEPPVMLSDKGLIQKAVEVLKSAERPLVIIGKGAAYGRAENNMLEFVKQSNIPFLPTPMGKGVVSDKHPLCISPARSRALLEADIIVLLGARLNWILHFGHPPRFNPSVKIIQVDLQPEELHNNVHSAVALAGDVNAIVKQLTEEIISQRWSFSKTAPWKNRLQEKIDHNKKMVQEMTSDHSVPLNYYAPYQLIQSLIPSNAIIVSEGANTMDIGRSMLLNELPRHRLDAGTFGTMGVGLGFAIAAAVWCQDHHPEKRVICVEGDSAFGFSGMEYETMCRYKLPIIIIIFNNNGIYNGLDSETWNYLVENGTHPGISSPVSSLSPDAHYEHLSQVSGGKGFFVKTLEELNSALKTALTIKDQPCIINIMINPFSQRKTQDFGWLTKSNL